MFTPTFLTRLLKRITNHCCVLNFQYLVGVMAFVKPDLGSALPLVASGKVRELYDVDDKSLLFVASDRISAYDVIMKNVRFAL